jgi:hypothetical protein
LAKTVGFVWWLLGYTAYPALVTSLRYLELL